MLTHESRGHNTWRSPLWQWNFRPRNYVCDLTDDPFEHSYTHAKNLAMSECLERKTESENLLLANLPDGDRDRLEPYLEPVSLTFREPLVEFDTEIRYVYFLETAITSTVVRTPHGQTIEVGIMGAEGFVGLSLVHGVTRSNATVLVQIPGEALRMKASDFVQQISNANGPCREVLLRYANFFQFMVQQHAACNVAHRIEQRMCRWILLTHDRAGSNAFALTHEYLALMLGVRRATVTTIAQKMRENGIIDYTRGNLVVTNRELLEECSCECYRVIKQQLRRTFG